MTQRRKGAFARSYNSEPVGLMVSMGRNLKAASPSAGLRTGVPPSTKAGRGVACPASWKETAAGVHSYRIMIKDGSAIRPYPEACTECPLHETKHFVPVVEITSKEQARHLRINT